MGLFDGEGNAVNWVCYTTQREDHSWARLPDGSEDWDEVARGTPGSTNLRLEEQSTVLVEKGATWSYLDSGEYPGDDWTTEGFDDDTWASGTAPLGYGDSQTTQVSYGDNSSDKHPTTWFRLGFSMEGDLLERSDGMDLDLRVDDGCVVWINGEELMRQAMPDGDISADSYASATASGDGETSYAGYSYGTDRLVAGANVVAVEVHQANATSSDITIDLQLSLETWVEVE